MSVNLLPWREPYFRGRSRFLQQMLSLGILAALLVTSAVWRQGSAEIVRLHHQRVELTERRDRVRRELDRVMDNRQQQLQLIDGLQPMVSELTDNQSLQEVLNDVLDSELFLYSVTELVRVDGGIRVSGLAPAAVAVDELVARRQFTAGNRSAISWQLLALQLTASGAAFEILVVRGDL